VPGPTAACHGGGGLRCRRALAFVVRRDSVIGAMFGLTTDVYAGFGAVGAGVGAGAGASAISAPEKIT